MQRWAGLLASGVTIGGGAVVGSGRGVVGYSTGGGDGGRGSTEGARVDAESLGVAIDVAKISAILWIACNCSSPILEKGVAGEVVVSAAVMERVEVIDWLVGEACGTGHW